MARQAKTRYAILGILNMEPMSGYDIRLFIKGSISNFWQESYGSIYPALKKLHEEGLVSKRTESAEGAPDRHVYELTESGHQELERWLIEPPEPRPKRNELLLKLFFGQMADRASMIKHLEQFITERIEKRAHLEGIASEVEKSYGHEEGTPFWLITLRFGIRRMESELQWARESVATLKETE